MRIYSPATAEFFATRNQGPRHILVWFSARVRGTSDIETIGFWTGADHRDFVINGQARTYYGAGAMLGVDQIKWSTGLRTRTQRITLSQISTAVQQLVRGYDTRHAPVEIHRALYDAESRNLVDEPHLIMPGYVDKLDLTTPPKGGSGDIKIEIASQARALTKPLNRYRSHASRIAAVPGDTLRKYATRADGEVPWGGGKTKAGTADPKPVNPFPGNPNK